MLLFIFFPIFAAMKTKDFFGKFVNIYLLGNLLAMVLVIVALCLGVKYGLEWYTHGHVVYQCQNTDIGRRPEYHGGRLGL